MPLGAARFGFQSGESFIEATGGNAINTYTESGVNYKAHVFTSSGNFVVSSLGSDGATQILLVAGGGSAGGGNEGRDSSSSGVSGGSFNIGDGDGGGPGGDSSYSSHYGRKGGKPYEPQTIVGGQNSISDIAKALGVVYKEGIYWWWSDYVWGNGGAGSRYGVGMDGVPRDGFYGGYGWIMVIMDSNSY